MIRDSNSIYPARDRSAWILAQRPPRATEPDPFRPNGVFLERERLASGEIASSGVVLLTNRECPWKCAMCDLWQHTTRDTVPVGAIPRQIEHAVRTWSKTGPLPGQVKLYNSGSFFDPAAIPLDDYRPIAERIAFAGHVVVESHPLLVGDRTLQLRDLLSGTLEVAMGLETAHPEALEKLNKKFTLEQFARAAALLAKEQIALRVFLLVHPPFVAKGAATLSSGISAPRRDAGVAVPAKALNSAMEWLRRSVDFAFECGAAVVTLIPTRGGNGAMERLRESGEWSPPTLADLEESQGVALAAAIGRGRVFADTWGLDSFTESASDGAVRRQRIDEANLRQCGPAPNGR